MRLKPITMRLDEEEYEKLKENLGRFGDPDINIAYVIRAYIRDLNRAFPYIMSAGWDLKNYFGLIGIWLRQFVRMVDADTFKKEMIKWWPNWFTAVSPDELNAEGEPSVSEKTRHSSAQRKGGDKKV